METHQRDFSKEDFHPSGSPECKGTSCITCGQKEFACYKWKVGRFNYTECVGCGHRYVTEDANLPSLRSKFRF